MKRAFTLIELLVVITIIAVLLALLMPAMDKAVYQADLAVCGAQMKGVGTGVTSYAAEYARHYPYRAAPANEQPYRSNQLVFSNPRWDDRPVLRGHVSLKMLVDPLGKPINLDHPITDGNYVYASYSMWWSWHWFTGDTISVSERWAAMTKLGDRFVVPGSDAKLSLLAADWFSVNTGAWSQASHPDAAAVAYARSLQNEASGGNTLTVTQWFADDASKLGTVDRNFLDADGSIRRITALKIDPQTDEPDQRLISSPAYNNTASTPTVRDHIAAD